MARKVWSTLFTSEERRQIRERYQNEPKLSYRALALELGVGYNTVLKIIHGDYEDREDGRRHIEPTRYTEKIEAVQE